MNLELMDSVLDARVERDLRVCGIGEVERRINWIRLVVCM